MDELKDIIREINKKLHIPQPERSQVIMEIYDDLEDTYKYYLQKYDQEAALVKTKEKFNFNSKTIDQLVNIHSSKLTKALQRFSFTTRTKLEKWILTISITTLLTYFLITILTTELFRMEIFIS